MNYNLYKLVGLCERPFGMDAVIRKQFRQIFLSSQNWSIRLIGVCETYGASLPD